MSAPFHSQPGARSSDEDSEEDVALSDDSNPSPSQAAIGFLGVQASVRP